jgi:plasmid stabilization system protein ParE
MYSIAYLPKALEEYKESITWYAERSIQASENFIIEIQECIETIRNNPTKFKNKYQNYFEISLNKYPFDIVYIIESDSIIIISIYHQKRNPRKKYRRK